MVKNPVIDCTCMAEVENYCGSPAVLKGPFRFSLSHYLQGCMDVAFSSTKKVNLRLYKVNVMTDFCETWYLGSTRNKCYLCGVSLQIAHLHICSDWLIMTKANIQSW